MDPPGNHRSIADQPRYDPYSRAYDRDPEQGHAGAKTAVQELGHEPTAEEVANEMGLALIRFGDYKMGNFPAKRLGMGMTPVLETSSKTKGRRTHTI